MSGLDRSKSCAAAHPIGQSNQNISNQHRSASNMTEQAKEKQANTIETVKNVVTAPFDFLKWIFENWQLATIGIIALYILIKD